eukprot:Gb_18476 [translate_table: standard]
MSIFSLPVDVGLQRLCRFREEKGLVGGLGLIPDIIGHFDSSNGLRVPHIHWNALQLQQPSIILEGVGSRQHGLHTMQETLCTTHGSQCGYCTLGFVISMYVLMRSNKELPSEEQIEECLAGNLRHCTGIFGDAKFIYPSNGKPCDCEEGLEMIVFMLELRILSLSQFLSMRLMEFKQAHCRDDDIALINVGMQVFLEEKDDETWVVVEISLGYDPYKRPTPYGVQNYEFSQKGTTVDLPVVHLSTKLQVTSEVEYVDDTPMPPNGVYAALVLSKSHMLESVSLMIQSPKTYLVLKSL